MTVLTDGNRGGDVVKSEFDPIVHCESKEYTNAGTDVEVFDAGYPWSYTGDAGTPLAAADVANLNGILIQELRVEAGQSVKVNLLCRGPVALNSDNLPTEDIDGDAYDAGDFTDALVALGFVMRTGPETTEVQTT